MIRTIATTNDRLLAYTRIGCLLCGLTVLGGCVTTGTGTAVECGAFRRITYSAKKDTPPTVHQVRVHNRTMDNLGCPR